MLGAVMVALKGKDPTWFNNDLLNLVAFAQMKRLITASGTMNRKMVIDLVSALG
jgi:hypothetical protein